MGMSGDFEAALEMGSTNVRVGSTQEAVCLSAWLHIGDAHGMAFQRHLGVCRSLMTGKQVVGVFQLFKYEKPPPRTIFGARPKK